MLASFHLFCRVVVFPFVSFSFVGCLSFFPFEAVDFFLFVLLALVWLLVILLQSCVVRVSIKWQFVVSLLCVLCFFEGVLALLHGAFLCDCLMLFGGFKLL